MEEFVRPADCDDVAVLAQLEAEARATLGEVERGGPQWLSTHPELREIGWAVRLADPGWHTVVAGVDAAVLGFGTLRLPLGDARAVATVDGIYVTPEGREVGLGESVLVALLDAASAGGAEQIDATALPGDRETKNLYERMGLVARLIIVSRRLGQP